MTKPPDPHPDAHRYPRAKLIVRILFYGAALLFMYAAWSYVEDAWKGARSDMRSFNRSQNF